MKMSSKHGKTLLREDSPSKQGRMEDNSFYFPRRQMNRNRLVGMEELGKDPKLDDVSVEGEIFGTKQKMAPKNRKRKNTGWLL